MAIRRRHIAGTSFAVCLLAAVVMSARVSPSVAPGNVFLQDPYDGPPETVELPRLYGDATRLDGQYSRVTSYRLTPDGDIIGGIEGTADFRYMPSADTLFGCSRDRTLCSEFDAVNVYYHIDKFATEFWRGRLGLNIDFQAQVQVHADGGGGFANPSEWSIKFGLGATMMKNAALQDDIVYHEYAHLVTHALGFVVDTTSLVQARALNEGYAHYFAASYTDDPRIGEWVVRCPPREHCVGPENDEEMATVDTHPAVWNWNDGKPSIYLAYGVCTRYHDVDGKCKIGYHNFSDVYTWGMIWGSTLWDIRRRVGADVADRLAVHGILKMDVPNPQFDDAVKSLVAADLKIYGGIHVSEIKEVLEERGFTSIAEHLGHSGTGDELPHQLTFRMIGANPVSDHARFEVDLPHSGRVAVVVYDAAGRRVAVLEDGFLGMGRHELTWSPGAFVAGKYFVVLTSGPTRKTLALTFIP